MVFNGRRFNGEGNGGCVKEEDGSFVEGDGAFGGEKGKPCCRMEKDGMKKLKNALVNKEADEGGGREMKLRKLSWLEFI